MLNLCHEAAASQRGAARNNARSQSGERGAESASQSSRRIKKGDTKDAHVVPAAAAAASECDEMNVVVFFSLKGTGGYFNN